MEGLIVTIGFGIVAIFAIVKSIVMVSQGEQVIVERLGKYRTTLTPGLNFITPFIDKHAYSLTTRDIVLEIPGQEVITKDNAVLNINAVAYINIQEPKKAVYGVENFNIAIINLVQTTLRSIVGDMALDETLSSRDTIKGKLIQDLDTDILNWGIKLNTVEIQDVNPSETMQKAMEAQASAERHRRATVTEAEGLRDAQRLEAEGRLQAAEKDAEAAVKLATAQKEAVQLVAESIQDPKLSAMYLLGEKYVAGITKLAESSNAKTVVYPADLQATVQQMLTGIKK